MIRQPTEWSARHAPLSSAQHKSSSTQHTHRAKPMVLGLGQQSQRRLALEPHLVRQPRAKRMRLVVVDHGRQRWWQGHLFEQQPQSVAMQPCRSVKHPKRRPLGVAKGPPPPAVGRPPPRLSVPPRLDKLEKLPVADEVLGRAERRHGERTASILVVPAKAWPVGGLAEHGGALWYRQQGVVRGGGGHVGVGGGPCARFAEQVQGQFAHEHRGGFDVDALVFKAHEERPAGRILHRVDGGAIMVELYVCIPR